MWWKHVTSPSFPSRLGWAFKQINTSIGEVCISLAVVYWYVMIAIINLYLNHWKFHWWEALIFSDAELWINCAKYKKKYKKILNTNCPIDACMRAFASTGCIVFKMHEIQFMRKLELWHSGSQPKCCRDDEWGRTTERMKEDEEGWGEGRWE